MSINVQIVSLIIVKNLIMENSNIIENNQLLANFLGIKVSKFEWKDSTDLIIGKFEGYDHDLHFFNPNANWTWLMPVVEKIESLEDEHHGRFGVHIYSNTCSIQGTNLHLAINDSSYGYVYMSDPNAVFNTKLESTYYNVVEFIKWWNEYKSHK